MVYNVVKAVTVEPCLMTTVQKFVMVSLSSIICRFLMLLWMYSRILRLGKQFYVEKGSYTMHFFMCRDGIQNGQISFQDQDFVQKNGAETELSGEDESPEFRPVFE